MYGVWVGLESEFVLMLRVFFDMEVFPLLCLRWLRIICILETGRVMAGELRTIATIGCRKYGYSCVYF